MRTLNDQTTRRESRSAMNKLLYWAMRPRIAICLTLGLALVVAVATLTPSDHMPTAPGSDKLHHFLAFGAVAFPMAFARPAAFLWIVMAVSAYGGIIELIQPFMGRHGDVRDAITNALGALTGGASGALLRLLVSRRQRALVNN
jgi:VanZ family protein